MIARGEVSLSIVSVVWVAYACSCAMSSIGSFAAAVRYT